MASKRHVTTDTTARVALFFVPLGLLAWLSGLPFVFPSLGPSAYVLAVLALLAVERSVQRLVADADTSRPSQVVGGHLIGIAAGGCRGLPSAARRPECTRLAPASALLATLLAATAPTAGMLDDR
ncbi:MAG: hypothetical protein U5K28_01710 [Halobacteriales archaeon]|nr:hypothetical protein [Halobacteriales archaeon]